MTVVLEKVQRLERYVQAANGQVDEIIESSAPVEMIKKLRGRVASITHQKHLEGETYQHV